MEITLRKASALLSSILETANSVTLAPTVLVDLFSAPYEAVSSASSKFDSDFGKKWDLFKIYYELREKLAITNALVGVSAALAEQKWIEKQLSIYKAFEGAKPALDTKTLSDKHFRLQEDRKLPLSGYASRQENYLADVLSESLLKDFIKATSLLKLEKQRLSDRLLELNVKNTITLDESHISALKNFNLI